MTRSILFVDHAEGLGGAERSLLLLMRHLDPSRWQPHLATVHGSLAKAATSLNFPVHILPMPQLRRSPLALIQGWSTSSELAQISRQINAIALHSNTVRAAFFTAAAAKLARKPFIWHYRDFWLSETKPAHRWIDLLLTRLLCRVSDIVLANSQAVRAKLPCQEKGLVVHNGIETAHFSSWDSSTLTFRQQLGIPPQTAVIGMVGRLRPWKGQRNFLQMAKGIHKQNPNTHFLIVGGNPFEAKDDYANELRQLARELGLETAVSFLGQLDDVRPALAAMDIFVHPGEPEPFGLVNIEAMAMGKPVVAWAHGALPDFVQHQDTGILVPHHLDMWPLFTASILNLVADPEKAKRMGEAGRQRVKAKFDIRQTAVRVAEIYEQHILPT